MGTPRPITYKQYDRLWTVDPTQGFMAMYYNPGSTSQMAAESPSDLEDIACSSLQFIHDVFKRVQTGEGIYLGDVSLCPNTTRIALAEATITRAGNLRRAGGYELRNSPEEEYLIKIIADLERASVDPANLLQSYNSMMAKTEIPPRPTTVVDLRQARA